jgi:hypothetical protein
MRSGRAGERGLARLEKWPQYLAGALTETTFILGLTLVAFLLAMLATVIFR